MKEWTLDITNDRRYILIAALATVAKGLVMLLTVPHLSLSLLSSLVPSPYITEPRGVPLMV